MRVSLLVAAREYAENAQTKGFWIGLFLFPVILAAAIAIPTLLEVRGTPVRNVAIVDRSEEWGAIVREAVESDHADRVASAKTVWFAEQSALPPAEREEFEEPRRRFRVVELPADVDSSTDARLRETTRDYLLGDRTIEVDDGLEELFALVVLPRFLAWREDVEKATGIEFWTTNLADDDLQAVVRKGIETELRRREYLEVGMDEAEVERIIGIRAEIALKDPSKQAGEEEVDEFDVVRQWAPLGFVYILFVSIFTVSQMLLNSTIEEKSNRIVEVLFSSITAWELMVGKLLGVAAIGLTMLATWFITGYLVLITVGGLSPEQLGQVLALVFSSELILPFAMYFVLGYLLYAAVFLGIGSTCNTIKESQNYMGPVMVVSMVPLLTMAFIPKDPNGPLAVALSWVPPWTPFVMMNRAAASPPAFDLYGTTVLLFVSVVLAVWLAGRVFRANILRTGQPPRLVELLRSLRG